MYHEVNALRFYKRENSFSIGECRRRWKQMLSGATSLVENLHSLQTKQNKLAGTVPEVGQQGILETM